MAVRPDVETISRNNCPTTRADRASRPEVGSSTSRTIGAETNKMARETRRRSPPEMPPPPAWREPMELETATFWR
eukprot:scaffold207633_cov28-Tisochrysis_lutea.AAC.3